VSLASSAPEPAARAALAALVEAELRRPAPAGLDALVARLLQREGGARIGAVLFYGSSLRAGRATEGILDLYCLVDDYRAFYRGRRSMAWAARVLPPNVSYETVATPEGRLRAKVAVMSLAQFARAVRRDALETSIWARFCQPAILAYARDDASARATVAAVAEAVATAAWWAARLRTDAVATPKRLWTDLFRFTYGAELRAEGPERAALIYDHDAARYERILGSALAAAGVAVDRAGDGIRPALPPLAAAGVLRPARRAAGKAISVLRLLKAAFTFEDGVDYLCCGRSSSRPGSAAIPSSPARSSPGASGGAASSGRRRYPARFARASAAPPRPGRPSIPSSCPIFVNMLTTCAICSGVCAALTLERRSATPFGVAGGRARLR
jgi:hypothetical protein